MREVDIILPIYNVSKKYFEELISSISNQSFQDFRLLIGYDDLNSETIVREILNYYNHLEVVHIPKDIHSTGIFSNINKILNFSSSHYIQFLCQDDILKTNFLSENVRCLSSNRDVGMVFCQVDWADSNSIIYKKDAHKKLSQSSVIFNYANLQWHFLNNGCLPGNLSPVMIKGNIISDIGYFNESMRFAADFDYWSRLSVKYNICYLTESNIILRKHLEQASETIGISQLISDRKVIYSNIIDRVDSRFQVLIAKLYLNQTIGSNHLYHIFKSRNFKLLFNSSWYPFNYIIAFFFLIITINGRIKYFNIPHNLQYKINEN